jgi:hypothetical protein
VIPFDPTTGEWDQIVCFPMGGSPTQLAQQKASLAPTKDGVYVVLVQRADPTWVKVGQLARTPLALGE